MDDGSRGELSTPTAATCNASRSAEFVAKLAALKQAYQVGAVDELTLVQLTLRHVSDFMGVDLTCSKSPESMFGPPSSAVNSRKRARSDSSDRDSDKNAEGEHDDHGAKSRNQSKSRNEHRPEQHQGSKKAMKNASAKEMFDSSVTCKTKIYVLIGEGADATREERSIPNTFVDKKNEERQVWAPVAGAGHEGKWYSAICGEDWGGGRLDATAKGFNSQVFKSKMQHNTHRTHTNRLIDQLPTQLEDGAKPIKWPLGSGVKYESVLQMDPIGDHPYPSMIARD